MEILLFKMNCAFSAQKLCRTTWINGEKQLLIILWLKEKKRERKLQ